MMTGASSQRSACRSRCSSRRDVFLSTSMPSEKLRFTCPRQSFAQKKNPEHITPAAFVMAGAMCSNTVVDLRSTKVWRIGHTNHVWDHDIKCPPLYKPHTSELGQRRGAWVAAATGYTGVSHFGRIQARCSA